jgi:hypothetical protein
MASLALIVVAFASTNDPSGEVVSQGTRTKTVRAGGRGNFRTAAGERDTDNLVPTAAGSSAPPCADIRIWPQPPQRSLNVRCICSVIGLSK